MGGRVGAAAGPSAFRKAFDRLRGRDGVQEALVEVRTVEGLGADVESNLRQAALSITAGHRASAQASGPSATQASVDGLTVVVGGGNDHSYAQLVGVREYLLSVKPGARLGCVNIDAHFDVRKPAPLITSGSPFYLALENGVVLAQDFVEFGIQRHCNGPDLWQYIESKPGLEVVPFEALRHGKAAEALRHNLTRLAARCQGIVISLDLDAAAACFAPGVSAPQAEGFSSSDLIEMAEVAGSFAEVCSLGIFELNPLHDIDGRTALLAATVAYHFMSARLAR